MARKALITGVRGQDGRYLAEALLKRGYHVIGTTHEPGLGRSIRVGGVDVPLVQLNLTDMEGIERLFQGDRFDEVYNLASRASSAQLFDDPVATSEVNGVAVARLLESINRHSPSTYLCQASSSEVFAGSEWTIQDESTPRIPRNAYGAAKAFADHLVGAYRTTFGLFACSAVLFSHESPRRPAHFVVRKITMAAAVVATGRPSMVTLESLDSSRDWGYAPDYVDAMRRMLQAEEPRDYVIATGEAHTVQDVCEVAFGYVDADWRDHIAVSENPERRPDRVARVGNAKRAATELGWAPTCDFKQMIVEMVDSDIDLLSSSRTADPLSDVFKD